VPPRRGEVWLFASSETHARSKTGVNTRAVFGDYISIYDIQRGVADKAMLPPLREPRCQAGVEPAGAAEDR